MGNSKVRKWCKTWVWNVFRFWKKILAGDLQKCPPVPPHAETSWERCSAALSCRQDDPSHWNLSLSEGAGASVEGRAGSACRVHFLRVGSKTHPWGGRTSVRFPGDPQPKVKCLILGKSKGLRPGPENQSSGTIAALFWVGDKGWLLLLLLSAPSMSIHHRGR